MVSSKPLKLSMVCSKSFGMLSVLYRKLKMLVVTISYFLKKWIPTGPSFLALSLLCCEDTFGRGLNLPTFCSFDADGALKKNQTFHCSKKLPSIRSNLDNRKLSFFLNFFRQSFASLPLFYLSVVAFIVER